MRACTLPHPTRSVHSASGSRKTLSRSVVMLVFVPMRDGCRCFSCAHSAATRSSSARGSAGKASAYDEFVTKTRRRLLGTAGALLLARALGIAAGGAVAASAGGHPGRRPVRSLADRRFRARRAARDRSPRSAQAGWRKGPPCRLGCRRTRRARARRARRRDAATRQGGPVGGPPRLVAPRDLLLHLERWRVRSGRGGRLSTVDQERPDRRPPHPRPARGGCGDGEM